MIHELFLPVLYRETDSVRNNNDVKNVRFMTSNGRFCMCGQNMNKIGRNTENGRFLRMSVQVMNLTFFWNL